MHRRERGQSLVETALVLPIFILLLVVLFDLGRAVFTLSTVGEAARQGTRVGAVNQIPSALDCDERRPVENPSTAYWAPRECAAMAGRVVGVELADVTVSYSAPVGSSLTCEDGPPPDLQVGCVVTVTVEAEWQPITPIVSGIVGTMTLTGTSEMTIERVFP